MLKVLEKVKATLKQREKLAHEGWWALVHRLARDEDVSADTVRDVLIEANRTVEDLERDVALVRKRLEWERQIREADKAQKEADKLTRDLEKLQRELDKLMADYESRMEPLRARLAEIEELRQQAWDATAKLFETCPYGELKEELRAATAELEKADREYATLSGEVDILRGRLSNFKEPRGVIQDKAEVVARTQQENVIRAQLAEAEARLKELLEKKQAAERRLREVEEKMRRP